MKKAPPQHLHYSCWSSYPIRKLKSNSLPLLEFFSNKKNLNKFADDESKIVGQRPTITRAFPETKLHF